MTQGGWGDDDFSGKPWSGEYINPNVDNGKAVPKKGNKIRKGKRINRNKFRKIFVNEK